MLKLATASRSLRCGSALHTNRSCSRTLFSDSITHTRAPGVLSTPASGLSLKFTSKPTKLKAPRPLSAPAKLGATAGALPQQQAGTTMTTEVATLAGGCFWCLDACYRQLRGVHKVESGYADGKTKNPSYKEVCGGNTGHAEVVQITFDPAIVSYKELLEVFFTIHDPTQLNRQGNDTGTQYRSAILYHNDQQRATAEEVIQYITQEGLYSGKIVTQLKPYDPANYYPAEQYHQDYFTQNPGQGYCRAVVGPKVGKFRSKFVGRLVA